MIDRDSSGCIGDGITTNDTSVTPRCGIRFLNGRSLPATSISMSSDGGFGMGIRNYVPQPGEPPNPWYDPNCANHSDSTISGTSYLGNPVGNSKHNSLELGSETPHQMGWYWITLASEYALLQQNGQEEEAQRTLEELFLALQAYRRLDMMANCLADERYDEITADFEVENCSVGFAPPHTGDCLCGSKYTSGSLHDPAPDDLDTPCVDSCDFAPNLSGYSGFFVREDAVQDLEALHDPSEDKWNIDLVGSSFAMSQNPPCSTTFSQACFLAGQQDFISQDQLITLMMGLTFVKRYIPENAVVSTCDGNAFNVLDIAKDISRGLASVASNNERRINWPGADKCCWKEAHISAEQGGNMTATYAGVLQMNNYICGCDDEIYKIKKRDKLLWNAYGDLAIATNQDAIFFLEGTAFGQDIGNMSNSNPGVGGLIAGIGPVGARLLVVGTALGIVVPGTPWIAAPTRD